MTKYRFEKILNEGNPLARNKNMQARGIHSALISHYRQDKSPKENKEAKKNLEASLKKKGFGYRKAKGTWDEGGGTQEEPSYHVYAKGGGTRHAAQLRHFIRKKSRELNQDAFIHVDDKGKGTAIATSTAHDKRKGERTEYGDMRNNVRNPYGETHYKPRKPVEKRPKFSFIPKD